MEYIKDKFRALANVLEYDLGSMEIKVACRAQGHERCVFKITLR